MQQKHGQVTFRRLWDPSEAERMVHMLRAHDLQATFHDNGSLQDQLFIGSQQAYYHVLLPPADFERAEQVLMEAAAEVPEEPDPDDPFHSFSDDELIDVLLNADEWNSADVVKARGYLTARNVDIPEQRITQYRETRLEELRAPLPPQRRLVFCGYLAAVMGGFLGVGIGAYMNTAKKSLPNGERVPVYRPSDRRHGFHIFVLGIIMLVGITILRLVRM